MKADSSVLYRGKVLFVSGKGGTGKTSVAAAVGRVGAAQGRKTVVVELDNQRPSLTPIFGVVPTHHPREVGRNLSVCNVEWVEALDDWLTDIVSIPRIVGLILKNRVVTVFLTATPGARDLVMLWRVYQLSKSYDLVVVDMPASGNATAMLGVPATARRLFDAGPIRKCAEELIAFFGRPEVRLALVALPEDMVVTETMETWKKLKAELPMLSVPLIVLNRSTMPSLDEGEKRLLERLSQLPAASPENGGLGAEVLAAGRWEANLEAATAESLERLSKDPGIPVLALPVLNRGEGAARVVGQIGSALARASVIPVDWVEAG